jgi:competence protein CoiA
MQLYALDLKGQLVQASQALKQVNYHCSECQQIVRLRGGPYRQSHFYHLDPTPFCRQHQKGPIHLQLQSYFMQQLPPGDCILELRFPLINRIADVAWLSQKIVFEIQYSAIAAEEVQQRNRDYAHAGWRVVWILHDQRYNQKRLSAAEMALRASPHFFSNMNRLGQGMIYDQFDICEKGLRQVRLAPLPIDFTRPRFDLTQGENPPLKLLAQRAQDWKLSFEGDLMSVFCHHPLSLYLEQAMKQERAFYPQLTSTFDWNRFLHQIWKRGVVVPYQILFRFLLERLCR